MNLLSRILEIHSCLHFCPITPTTIALMENQMVPCLASPYMIAIQKHGSTMHYILWLQMQLFQLYIISLCIIVKHNSQAIEHNTVMATRLHSCGWVTLGHPNMNRHSMKIHTLRFLFQMLCSKIIAFYDKQKAR